MQSAKSREDILRAVAFGVKGVRISAVLLLTVGPWATLLSFLNASFFFCKMDDG